MKVSLLLLRLFSRLLFRAVVGIMEVVRIRTREEERRVLRLRLLDLGVEVEVHHRKLLLPDLDLGQAPGVDHPPEVVLLPRKPVHPPQLSSLASYFSL